MDLTDRRRRIRGVDLQETDATLLVENETETIKCTVGARLNGGCVVGGHQGPVIGPPEVDEYTSAAGVTGCLRVPGEMQQTEGSSLGTTIC